MDQLSLMERVAVTRLRRFERVARVAETSESPIWRDLARRAAHNAYRDCLLAAYAAGRSEVLVPPVGEAA